PLPKIIAETPVAPRWPLGEPDKIVRFPKPEKIPATGVVDYRNIPLAIENDEPVWLAAMGVKPGNRKVVHHVVVREKTAEPGQGAVFVTYSPGITPRR